MITIVVYRNGGETRDKPSAAATGFIPCFHERRPCMSILICDICGTSYPDSEEKCPTCGYARAFDEAGMLADRPHAVHEKVRGGRFSRKNVRRRMRQKQEAGEEAQPVIVHHGAADLPEAEPDPVEQEQAAPVEIAAPVVSVPEPAE